MPHRLTLTVLVVIAYFFASPAQAQEDNRPPEGFLPLFNGKNFDGWNGGGTEDPAQYRARLEAMTGEQRKAHREQVKEQVRRHWRVEDGQLISDGKGPNLVSWRYYADFEMWVDWKLMAPGADSGIYLRHCPQVQLWDPGYEPAHKHGADKGSGGLWNNKRYARHPSEVADKPIGQWNRMYIRMVGPYVTVRLNGKTVVDRVVMENMFDRAMPVYGSGPVHLQTHGGETRFRNIFIRRIDAEEANRELVQIAGGEQAFTPLFNGEDLAGWIGATDSYEVRGGAIVCKRDHGGNLITEKQYSDFTVRLEFNTPPGGNNGLAIRTPDAEANPADDALELQVLDNNHIRYIGLKDYQFHGSAYGIAPALRGYLRPAGQWNYQQVTVRGDHVVVELNGFKILDLHLMQQRGKRLSKLRATSADFTRGHFGFSGHDDPVAFRNIRIKELD